MTDLRHSVFISYTHNDASEASLIAEGLTQRGFKVKTPPEISPSSDWKTTLSETIEATDSVVALISSPSFWQEKEISYMLDRRGVDVIPVLLKSGQLPEALENRTAIDLTNEEASIDDLALRIQIGYSLNLLNMPPRDFEKLVGELLESEGFRVTHASSAGDSGYDLIARSPGTDASEPKEYKVQVKAYRDGRVSVAGLHRIAKAAIEKGAKRSSMIVTNGQLTSVAVDMLRDLATSPGSPDLQVIDGIQLKYLIMKHPNLALKYSRHTDDGR